jgi:hypothetical protein
MEKITSSRGERKMTKSDKATLDAITEKFNDHFVLLDEDIFKLLDIIKMQEMELDLLRSQFERTNSISNYYESKYNELLEKQRGLNEEISS